MDWTQDFVVKNVSHSKLIAGILTILHDETRLIEIVKYSPEVIDVLKYFHTRKKLEATNDTSEFIEQEREQALPVKKISTENHEHTVFDGKKAIEVTEIDTSAKAIEVHENLSDNRKAIEVHSPQMDKIEAKELIDSHWRKFESEVKKIADLRKLNLLQVVAIEVKAADKKKQIIEDRIKELS